MPVNNAQKTRGKEEYLLVFLFKKEVFLRIHQMY